MVVGCRKCIKMMVQFKLWNGSWMKKALRLNQNDGLVTAVGWRLDKEALQLYQNDGLVTPVEWWLDTGSV